MMRNRPVLLFDASEKRESFGPRRRSGPGRSLL